MKVVRNFLFLVCICLLSGGCTKDDIKILRQAEDILPGLWLIESVNLPKYGLGITYQGVTFIADTILFDIGSIHFSNFDAKDLDPGNLHEPKVICDLMIGNDHIPVSINGMRTTPNENFFTYFAFNGPEGVHPIESPGEEFFWSSFIFNNNYILEITDAESVILRKANDLNGHVIRLVKS